jgi:signal transduction histidine kinase
MTLKDIEDKWMVIGTNNKRKEIYSPDPFKRRYVGEKGIGRFAVDKLGQYVKIRTKQVDDKQELVVTINWETYQNLAEGDQTKLSLFTDIENEYEWVEPTFEKGTILEILNPRELWTLDDISRSYKELSRLVSPFHESKYPFNIFIKATEFEPYLAQKRVENDEKQFASRNFELNYDIETEQQEYLFFDNIEQKVVVKKGEKQNFGFIKFHLYYFDRDAKDRFNAHHKGTFVHIDGIKIYRDGILTTPFAEYEAEDEKRRDILGINKRRWRATFDRMGTRDCIGYIEITRDGNPQIIDATNRQDFLSTKEYSELKDFIYEQLDTFMKTRKVEREEKTKERLDSFDTAKGLMEDLQREFKRLRNAKTEKKQEEIVASIAEKLPEMEKGLMAVTLEYSESKKEEERKEKMYFSLMSLSLFAANISHAVRTTIYSINDDAAYIHNKIIEEKLKTKAERINREIQRLLVVVDFMLKYAKTDLPAEYFNVKTLINNVFDAHETIFMQKRIDCKLDIEPYLSLYGNEVFFQDIITNLISNSIKALEGNFTKEISCTATANQHKMTLLFSDNGIGIPENKREWVFGMYNTTTQEQGGAGIGLYVVKTNVEALGGQVVIEDNEEHTEGATIKITIPFKK